MCGKTKVHCSVGSLIFCFANTLIFMVWKLCIKSNTALSPPFVLRKYPTGYSCSICRNSSRLPVSDPAKFCRGLFCGVRFLVTAVFSILGEFRNCHYPFLFKFLYVYKVSQIEAPSLRSRKM